MRLFDSNPCNSAISLLFLPLLCHVRREFTSTIKTENGRIVGEILKTVSKSVSYSAFRGIPYARPPVGDLRFQNPQEPDHWDQTLYAVEDGNSCPQLDSETHEYIGDEDCLYLNVYTKQTNFRPLLFSPKPAPVLVYFHGGRYVSQSANISSLGPDFLIEEDVVVVVPNFRLGALGLLSLNIPEAPGNLQLKDQVMVLQWVRRNIEEFGGDPRSVTIMGTDSGAVAVDLHMISGASQGLFHRAISISGVAWNVAAFSSPNEAEERAFRLGLFLGIDTDNKHALFNELKRRPAEELVRSQQKLTEIDYKFKPTIEIATGELDYVFLNDCPLRLYKYGKFAQVPYLLMFMKDELLSFASSPHNLLGTTRLAYEQLNYGDGYFQGKLKNQGVFLQNFLGLPLEALPLPLTVEMINNLTDILVGAPIDLKRELLATSSAPLYVLRQSYDPEEYSLHRLQYGVDPILRGAGHGDEKYEIFYDPSKNVTLNDHHPFSIARRQMVRLLGNFVKTGNPTPDGIYDSLLNIIWPPSTASEYFLDFGEKLTIGTSIINDNIRRLRNKLSGFPWETLNGCYAV